MTKISPKDSCEIVCLGTQSTQDAGHLSVFFWIQSDLGELIFPEFREGVRIL